MHWIREEVPWADLFRTVVTTLLFVLVLGVPVALLTPVEEVVSRSLFLQVVTVAAFVFASIVVWSDRVRWIGDPDPTGDDAAVARRH